MACAPPCAATPRSYLMTQREDNAFCLYPELALTIRSDHEADPSRRPPTGSSMANVHYRVNHAWLLIGFLTRRLGRLWLKSYPQVTGRVVKAEEMFHASRDRRC